MKIVIIGASGTIGSAVATALAAQHQLITLGRNSGDYHLDIADPSSIKKALKAIYEQHGAIDALICAAGSVAFKTFVQLDDQDWQLGLTNKLMGQINLVRIASDYLAADASITLTSGILAEEHIVTGVSAGTINAALHGFVTAVAPVMTNKIRINCVCPTVLEESMDLYSDYFPGFVPVSAKKVAQAYLRSVLGINTGEILKVY